MIIRNAKLEDLEQALVLGWEMHQESRYSSMSYNMAKVSAMFGHAVESDDYIFCVAEKDGRLIGGFIGYAISHWFSDDLVASDFALFISQDFRGGSAAFRLVKNYIDWAESKGVNRKNITVGITTGIDTNKTQKFYEKMGFKKNGVTMNLQGDF